jgi:hypothetical protein
MYCLRLRASSQPQIFDLLDRVLAALMPGMHWSLLGVPGLRGVPGQGPVLLCRMIQSQHCGSCQQST